MRNQTRYNETSRDAVITAIQSVASYVPETETVIFSRQANYRENAILSNQTSLTGRLTTGRLAHALTAGLEFIGEDYSAPGMGGAGTREPESIYDPEPVRADRRLRAGPERRHHRRQDAAPSPCRPSTSPTSASCS